MYEQNIGVGYIQKIEPKDGKAWEQTMLDIRTIGLRKKFLLHPDGSVLFNVAHKGELMPWIKVGKIKNKKGWIFDPISMVKPVQIFCKDIRQDEAVIPNQIFIITTKFSKPLE